MGGDLILEGVGRSDWMDERIICGWWSECLPLGDQVSTRYRTDDPRSSAQIWRIDWQLFICHFSKGAKRNIFFYQFKNHLNENSNLFSPVFRAEIPKPEIPGMYAYWIKASSVNENIQFLFLIQIPGSTTPTQMTCQWVVPGRVGKSIRGFIPSLGASINRMLFPLIKGSCYRVLVRRWWWWWRWRRRRWWWWWWRGRRLRRWWWCWWWWRWRWWWWRWWRRRRRGRK